MRFQACLFAFLLGLAVTTVAYVPAGYAQESGKTGMFSLFGKNKNSSSSTGKAPIFLDKSKTTNQNQASGAKPIQPYKPTGMNYQSVTNSGGDFNAAMYEVAMKNEANAAQTSLKQMQYAKAKMAEYEASKSQKRLRDMRNKVGYSAGSTSGSNKTYVVKEPRKKNTPIRLFNTP